MSRTTYLKIFNYYNQSCSRKYKLLLPPFTSNFSFTTNTLRRFWGCRDPAADRNLVLTFYFGLALPTLSTVLTVHTQTAIGVSLVFSNITLSHAVSMDRRQNVRGPKSTVNNRLRTPNVLGSAQICDLPEFKRNYSTYTKFVNFNSLTT